MAEVQPTRLRVVIYARVSTEEQKEGQTIDSQVGELERFAKERGWEIAGRYSDTSMISHYERGQSLPPLLTALRLEIIYRVPCD